MKKSASQSGVVNPRALVAFALGSAGVLLAIFSLAANPQRGVTGSVVELRSRPFLANKHASPLSNKRRAEPESMPRTAASPGPGPGWSLITSPSAGATHRTGLQRVACTSKSQCWAVGFFNDGSNYKTLIERWDGATWTIYPSPNNSAGNILEGVTCPSASDCWAVGYSTNASGIEQTLSEHWDGTTWTIVSSPNTSVTLHNFLNEMTCISTSQCWAVGFYNNGNNYQTLTEKWDGTSWTIVGSPNTSVLQDNYLDSVTCTSTSQCWAVGDYFDGTYYKALIEEWDGASWTIVSSPDTSAGLSGVTCASPSECWAVGFQDAPYPLTGKTLIEEWNGNSWMVVPSPNTNAQRNFLQSVACVSTSQCWAVGDYKYDGGVSQTLIEKWDGTTWTIVGSPNTSVMQPNYLNSVTCTSAFQCWAVDHYVNGNNVDQALIEEYSLTIPPLTSVDSVMTHGGAGPFPINLPLTGARGVECRSSASLGAGNYTVVFTFVNNVANCGTAGTTGGSVSSGPNANQCTENLTGVPNAQYTTVTLSNVVDSQNNTGTVSAPLGVLLGDTTGNGIVNSTDVSQTQMQAGQSVTGSNFRTDVNANGLINSTDVSTVQSKSGTGLTPPP